MSLEDLSLEQRDELAMLAKQLADNPKTRKEFLRMTQQVKPELSIPELEIEKYTNEKISKSEERVMKLENELRERDIRADLQSRRESLKTKGLARNDSDIEQIEKIMLEKNISNHETAAEYWDWMKQAATPTSDAQMGYNPSVMSKFNLEPYFKNRVQAARNEAAQALTDLKKNRAIGI
jgi:hypothetical protein